MSDILKKHQTENKAIFQLIETDDGTPNYDYLINSIWPDDKEPSCKKPILFKYLNFSHEILTSIKDDILYFTDPNHFNDPFDPILKTLYSEKIELLENISMACLSSTVSDILMWSHYADKHQGLCLAYDISAIIEQENVILQAVEYNDITFKNLLYTLKIVDAAGVIPNDEIAPLLAKQQKLKFMGLLRVKSLSWKYEKEYRLIITNQKGPVKHPKVPIVGVYLGDRMPEENKDIIYRWVKTINETFHKNIVIYKMSPNEHGEMRATEFITDEDLYHFK